MGGYSSAAGTHPCANTKYAMHITGQMSEDAAVCREKGGMKTRMRTLPRGARKRSYDMSNIPLYQINPSSGPTTFYMQRSSESGLLEYNHGLYTDWSTITRLNGLISYV